MFWHNERTGDLECRAAKSFKVAEALAHRGGWEGWQADAVREKDILRHLAGVPGVVGIQDFRNDPEGGIHLILEWVPLCRHFPLI